MKPFLRFVEDGLATVLDHLRPSHADARQTVLAARLTEELDRLMERQQTGDGSDFWRGVCSELRALATAGDPLFFMRWPPIEATMVHRASLWTYKAWWLLRRSPAWQTAWRPALGHPQLGHPSPFPPMMSTNAMTIEHASHLARFRHELGTPLEDTDCIVEFGGGYGSMCRLVRALGFRGTYIIFDLPPILALQRYYLGLHGIGADETGAAPVWLCPDLDGIKTWLDRTRPARVSLMSTWALSEMPIAVRNRVAGFFDLPRCTKALLAYQPSFEGIDNRGYFSGLQEQTADRWSWLETPVELWRRPPSPGDSRYVFGLRR